MVGNTIGWELIGPKLVWLLPRLGDLSPPREAPCTKLVTEIPRLSPNAEANTREIQKSEHNITSIGVASFVAYLLQKHRPLNPKKIKLICDYHDDIQKAC